MKASAVLYILPLSLTACWFGDLELYFWAFYCQPTLDAELKGHSISGAIYSMATVAFGAAVFFFQRQLEDPLTPAWVVPSLFAINMAFLGNCSKGLFDSQSRSALAVSTPPIHSLNCLFHRRSSDGRQGS